MKTRDEFEGLVYAHRWDSVSLYDSDSIIRQDVSERVTKHESALLATYDALVARVKELEAVGVALAEVMATRREEAVQRIAELEAAGLEMLAAYPYEELCECLGCKAYRKMRTVLDCKKE